MAKKLVEARVGSGSSRRSPSRSSRSSASGTAIKRRNALPEGIASGNGRIEAQARRRRREGAAAGQEDPRRRGRSGEARPGAGASWTPSRWRRSWPRPTPSVAAAQEQLAVAKASIVKQKSEIELAEIEVERSQQPRRRGRRLAARARRPHDEGGDDEGRASPKPRRCCRPPRSRSRSRRPNAATIQTRIDDATLQVARHRTGALSPGRARRGARAGRQGADAGEPGGRLHGDLPALGAGRGASRSAPRGGSPSTTTRSARSPGYVSFVSPEAQFTPKQVETKSEREKLMFRVKIQVPKELVGQYVERIKTGVRGVGYVKVKRRPRSGRRGCRTSCAGRAAGSLPSDRGTARWRQSHPPIARRRRPAGRLDRGRHPPLRQGRRARRHLARHPAPASWSASSAPTASASRRCWR